MSTIVELKTQNAKRKTPQRVLLRMALDERGVQLVEFVGLFPLVLLALVIGWQFALLGYTGVLASSAAREGARAAATRESVEGAVRGATPGFDGRRWWSAQGGYPCAASSAPVTVQVRLRMPQVTLPYLGAVDVYPLISASASARCEPPPSI
ncbi:MAG TPA: TadE/TadG family type IV pilus assembly protein [Roseiflexaceae bacterium]|nr:TadE/TadG family type IV pilus assembly protein [Roseiflexaceae bacterium]